MPKGEYLQYGGQAIIEGVMMRSPRYFSIACRAPNGEIVIQTEAIEKTWIGRQKWLKYPFLRGSLALLDSMALGSKAMRFSSALQMDPKYADPDEPVPEHVAETPKKTQDIAVGGALLVSLVFGVALFDYLPNTVAELSGRYLHVASDLGRNVISEATKAVIFFGYIGLIGLMPDIHEVFKYHGAEHKAINALEHDRPLEEVACLSESRIHPRCGTSFAIIVLLLGFVVFAFVPRYPLGKDHAMMVNVTIRFLLELLILPFIAGVSYELLRLAGRFRDQKLVNAAFQPGMWSQRLTTREPEPKHVEVALAALKACLAAEEGNHGPVPKEGDDIESAPPSQASRGCRALDERAWLIDYTCRDPAKIWTDERGTYRESLDDLTPPQRIYLLVWGLEAEVINGGFEQFVGNSTGDTAELVPSALWSIEAYACAALVERALRTLTPDPLPTESDARNELLGRRFEAVFATLRELDKAFYAEPDDLAHLLFKFIHAHPDDFGLAEK